MIDDRAAALRSRFDQAFAEAPAAPQPASYDYLRIRVGGEPRAIALTEIASLHRDTRVVGIPSPAPELLGIASIRAALVPIYDLRVALGAPAAGSPRWLVLVREGTAGFAFDGFDGHARSHDRGAPATGSAHALVALDGRPHLVIALGTLLGAIRERWKIAAGRRGAMKEQ